MEMRSIGNNLIVLWEQIERIGLLVTILRVSLEMQNLAWLRRMFRYFDIYRIATNFSMSMTKIHF